eukprot:ANDGO_01192.mRNA.1 Oil body-associated protein 1A
MLQKFLPLQKIHLHVCGLHCAADDAAEQVIAHHYCTQVNEGLRQCIIFDSGSMDAKLIGIEYIISERLFATLPPAEQQLWHSHSYEVSSGILVGNDLPETAETAVMSRLASTYGKTFHTWQVQRGDTLPLGLPRLMQSFTADGQVQQELLAQRDLVECYSTADKRRFREGAGFPHHIPHSEADALWHGRRLELQLISKNESKV